MHITKHDKGRFIRVHGHTIFIKDKDVPAVPQPHKTKKKFFAIPKTELRVLRDDIADSYGLITKQFHRKKHLGVWLKLANLQCFYAANYALKMVYKSPKFVLHSKEAVIRRWHKILNLY